MIFVKQHSLSIFLIFMGFVYVAHAQYQYTSYMTQVSDTITHSAPATSSSHTILFTIPQAVPANGAIEVYFDEGGLTIPAALDYTDVDVAFSAAPGGPYTERPLSWIQSAGTDDVTVTSGANGMIRIDLNTSAGIPANNEVQIEIGTTATYQSIGDVETLLDVATGTYPVTIHTYDVSDVEIDYGRTVFLIVDPVTAGPVDTTDTIPPTVMYSAPSGILQVGTRAVELLVQTDEIATCKYATSSMTYDLMPFNFYGTTTGLTIWHFAQESDLEDDTEYTYFVRCADFRNNQMVTDYELTFTIGIPPGSATSTATSTGSGDASGSASTTVTDGPGTGDDTGSGGGPTGSGSGDGPDGGDGGGSGSGGSGSSGSGDKLPQAEVLIDGWAYPNSTVYFIRDGVALADKSAGGDAYYSHLISGMDRGSYSFGVYTVDKAGVRSATFATTLWLQSGTLNELSNVMLPPSVHVEENSVDPGVPLAVSGYTAPKASVIAWLRPKLAEVTTSDIIATTTALTNGTWALTIPTTGLSQGTYEIVAQATHDNGIVESDKSARRTIGIGVSVSEGDCGSIGDLNCDGFVNLVDFSILLFNWNTTNEVADINDDGYVSLPDFSVMLYYWTG